MRCPHCPHCRDLEKRRSEAAHERQNAALDTIRSHVTASGGIALVRDIAAAIRKDHATTRGLVNVLAAYDRYTVARRLGSRGKPPVVVVDRDMVPDLPRHLIPEDDYLT